MGRSDAVKMVTAKATAVVIGAVVALAPLAAATASPAQPEPGETTSGTVTSNGAEFPYLLHTPASYDDGEPAPLVVVVHGCQTTAEQEMELSRYNELAEREGFVVAYPEVDAAGQQLPGPLNHCWRFYDPLSYFRGNNDVAAIAAVAQEVMAERSIDEERVYLVGVSAGGLMTSASAATYPDLYAAVAVVVSAGYADAPCFTTGVGIPVEASALLAFQQMGPRARVVPTMAIGGDADPAFPAVCAQKAVEQGLRTNNLVLSGAQDAPLALTPAATSEELVPDGLAYTVSTFLDPDGCVVGERWIIRGMAHTWPGGADYGGYTDTRAPDGAEATWAFLRRFRRSETEMPCAEASAASPTSTTTTTSPPSAVEPPSPPPSARAASDPAAARTGLPATGGGDRSATPALLAATALALGLVTRRARPSRSRR